MIRTIGSVMMLVAALAATGCGNGPAPAKKTPVSGTVKLNGQPLAEGVIYFKTPATGAVDSFEVKAGAYQGAAELGARRVEVASYETTKTEMGGMTTETKINKVSPKFSTESTLTADVKEGGPNTFDFEVTGK